MSLVDNLISSVPILDECSHFIEDSLSFRGKTLKEWESEIRTPYVGDNMSINDMHQFSIKFISINEIVMSNYAYAKSCYEMSSARYSSSVKRSAKQLIDAINNDSSKKMPGIDSIERTAAINCSEDCFAADLSRMFYEFWKIQADKIKSLDSRLNSMSFLMRN